LLDEAEFLDFDEGLILKDKVEYINPDRDEDNMVFGVVRDKFGQKLNPNSSDIDIRQANIPDDRVYSSQDVLQQNQTFIPVIDNNENRPLPALINKDID
jgi:hypothetical protein